MKTITALIFSLFATSVFAHSSHMMDDDAPPSQKNEMKKRDVLKERENNYSSQKAPQPAPKTAGDKKFEEKKQP